uniref:Protein kinase domain-containing protein n=1 Tax=Moniliophthora roreri TaxID=221103 RepID=A0A0W0F1P9_MONRR
MSFISTLELQLDAHNKPVIYYSSDHENCINSQMVACVVKPLGRRVYLASAGSREPRHVAVKIVHGKSEVRRLEHEADIYRKELKGLQGKIVPKFYGLYTASHYGVDAAVMILEYCGTGTDPTLDFNEFNRLLMLAACKLHQVGIVHGALSDHRHILAVGRQIRIIDFANAGHSHQCFGALPTLDNNSSVSRGCDELERLEREYGSQEMKTTHANLLQRLPQKFRQWIST